MPKVVTFGELMLRLSPPGFERFLQTPQFVATFGGGEANVAVCLAAFGIDSYYVTRLPKHEIGEAAVKALRAEGVRTDYILRGGDRDRRLLRGGRRQPARLDGHLRPRPIGHQRDGARRRRLGDGLRRRRRGITSPASRRRSATRARRRPRGRSRRRAPRASRISVDLNFRKKLWTEKQAQEVMGPLMRDVDVVIANEEDLQSVLGVHVPGTDVTSGQLNIAGFQEAAERVTRDFGPPMVAITLRESVSASDNGWSAALWDASTGSMHRSQRYDVRLVDRIGGGDSFAGGPDLRSRHRAHAARRAALRRRGKRAQADDPRRLQPRHRGRSRSACRRRRVRPCATVVSSSRSRGSVAHGSPRRISSALRGQRSNRVLARVSSHHWTCRRVRAADRSLQAKADTPYITGSTMISRRRLLALASGAVSLRVLQRPGASDGHLSVTPKAPRLKTPPGEHALGLGGGSGRDGLLDRAGGLPPRLARAASPSCCTAPAGLRAVSTSLFSVAGRARRDRPRPRIPRRDLGRHPRQLRTRHRIPESGAGAHASIAAPSIAGVSRSAGFPTALRMACPSASRTATSSRTSSRARQALPSPARSAAGRGSSCPTARPIRFFPSRRRAGASSRSSRRPATR